MDTKLKNLTRKWYLKGLACLIITGCVIVAALILKDNEEYFNMDTCYAKNYENSNMFFNNISHYLYNIKVVETNDSIEAIEAGIYEEEIKDWLGNPYEQWVRNKGRIQITVFEDGDYSYIYTDEMGDEKSDLTFEAFAKEYPKLIEEAKKAIIQNAVKSYKDAEKEIAREERFVYEAVEERYHAQMVQKYSAYPIYGYATPHGEIESNSSNLEYAFLNHPIENKEIFVAVSPEFYNQMEKQWQKQRTVTLDVLNTLLILFAVSFVMILYLTIVTGRKPDKNSVHFYPLDQIWSEIIFTVAFFSTACLGGIGREYGYTLGDTSCPYWMTYVLIIAAIILLGIVVECFLSQVRRLKAHRFLDGFICIRIVKKLAAIVKGVFRRGRLSRKAVLAAVILTAASATIVGAPFVLLLLLFLIYKYIGDFTEILEGTKKIKEGWLTYKIEVKNKESVFGDLAEDINSISQGLEASVANELRSERMKSELISNVSHDLKTPLTSIVTYVDLLKQEEIANDTAKDYIGVIDRKAQRLTVLTNDLFEAAKASSGDMPVNLEKVDLNAIIRQALGEFDERLNAANLEVRPHFLEKEAFILADGRLTWRVLDNLISNVVKYAQNNSRVYMEVEERENEITFTMKNISANELNIPAEELMERFKRGDDSRNSEGSGLGLNIANSLISLQHGSFVVKIDGDLFKVSFSLPKIKQ